MGKETPPFDGECQGLEEHVWLHLLQWSCLESIILHSYLPSHTKLLLLELSFKNLGLWFCSRSELDPYAMLPKFQRFDDKMAHLAENFWEDLYQRGNSLNKGSMCLIVLFETGTYRKGVDILISQIIFPFYDFGHKHVSDLHKELRFSSLKLKLKNKENHMPLSALIF